MADWHEALQDALYPVLTRLLQQGFVLPLYVTCIGRNGSMICGRYEDIAATGLDVIVVARISRTRCFHHPSICSSWTSGARRPMCNVTAGSTQIAFEHLHRTMGYRRCRSDRHGATASFTAICQPSAQPGIPQDDILLPYR
jgi:hypothetical protein